MSVANPVTEVNRVQFVSEDFQTYRDEADAFFAANYPTEFNNTIATDLGNAMLDQLAYAMQSLAFMINRRASELYLETALLNSSIVKLAQMLGYSISPAAPGSTDLTITLTDGPYAFPVPIAGIPNPFQWQGPGSTVYEYREIVPSVIPPGQTQITIPLLEGQSRKVSFTSNGQANQQFNIAGIPTGQFMYSNSLIVTVDGTPWTLVPLLKFESTNIFTVLFTANPPAILFGDGILGNIPPAGSEIVVFYVFGQGAAGSIGSNQISGPVTPLVIGGQSIPMSLTNTVGDVGSDPESIEHVQSFASSFFRTQNAAVIKSDYDTIAALQTGVAIADAEIIRGIAHDIILQGFLGDINLAANLILNAAFAIEHATVSGLGSLGVSGISSLFVGGTGSLFVGGTSSLGVSGIGFLGWDGSSVTGTQFLGVSGIPGLIVLGTGSLFVGGTSSLGVSGIAELGVSGLSAVVPECVSGIDLMETSVSGLESHLTAIMSDTSMANKVQVTVLGVDANNAYIAPPIAVLDAVQAALQPIADAVVTVFAVDGSSLIVPCDINIGLGINLTAVAATDILTATNALTQSTAPFGLLVRRTPGVSLYISQIQDAIEAAFAAAGISGDLVYMNIKIINPAGLLDANGNLIISPTGQQVIQNRNINVFIDKIITNIS